MRTKVIRVVLVALATIPLAFVPRQTAPAVAATRPNILLIVTDDMRASDLRWMPETRRLLGERGVTMKNFLSNHPLCCPARAEILSGQYAQNNGVHHNKGPWGGFHASNPNHNVAVWLQQAGYKTAFVGKYLNKYYGKDGVQPGWTQFNPTTAKQYSPYGFSALYDGHERVVKDVYTGDWVRQQTNRYIRRFSASGKPFFIYASQLAPHGMNVDGTWVPPVPAPRHRGYFPHVRPVSFKSPAFDKKSWITRAAGRVRRDRMVTLNRARLQALQAVDEANASAIRTLKRLGQLDNTYIFFTSDNGLHLGEHRHVGKALPYEESLKIPLLVRGPSIPRGVHRRQMTEHIDLAPTFLELAGARADVQVDGTSLLPVLRRNARGYGTVLVQSGSEVAPWEWRGVRTPRYTFVRYVEEGHVLLFDRKKDPYELRNVAGMPEYAATRARLEVRLKALENCLGADCRAASRGVR